MTYTTISFKTEPYFVINETIINEAIQKVFDISAISKTNFPENKLKQATKEPKFCELVQCAKWNAKELEECIKL